MTALHRPLVNEQAFPSQGIVTDHSGMNVDASGWVWTMNAISARRLDFRRFSSFPPAMLLSIVLYIAERIRLASTGDVRSCFSTLLYLLRSTRFAQEAQTGAPISTAFFFELRSSNGVNVPRLHHVRSWYRWCARQGLPQFSIDTAELLDDHVIGGDVKGRAVRTRDPVKGAFDDVEYATIITHLRARQTFDLKIAELCMLWLQVSFGRNALAYALMREADYRPVSTSDKGRVYHRFDIPQIKQQHEYLRAGFDPKNLNQEVGAVVAELIAENARRRIKEGWPEGCALPLFPRRSPQRALLGGPLHEFAMHMSHNQITWLLQRAMRKLRIASNRTDQDLHSNTRRFRYTFATRMVELGASPVELAIGLGHSDLQHVGVYYETRANQVERLDAAMATKLRPIANAFMGRIIDDEADAINGKDPAKRIPGFRRKFGTKLERGEDLGICGSGPCGLLAPVSCYTCEKFQPWKNGPHRDMLDFLVEERDRKIEKGLDPQMVKIHDATILAVGNVVAACEGGSQ